MEAHKTAAVGTIVLDVSVDIMKRVAGADLIPLEAAPAFMSRVAELLKAACEEFMPTAAAAAQDTPVPHGRSARLARMREQINAAGNAKTGGSALPIALKMLEDARSSDEATRLSDEAFRKKHPPLKGLTEANTVHRDGIVLLMDGVKKKMIKRYLTANYGITFEDYKRIYGLDEAYPSCAPDYAGDRRDHAIAHGLGKGPKARRGKKGGKAKVLGFQSAPQTTVAA